MIDLSTAQTGELGKETLFSDLFAAAVKSKFTGGILVQTDKDLAVFFRNGSPVHVGGSAFESHFVGELLVRQGVCAQSALVEALDQQASAQGKKPLLGAILVAQAGVDPNVVKRAICEQTLARTYAVFGLTEGTWQAAPGENARIREIGIPTGGLDILAEGLRKGASDLELKRVADELLGSAVLMTDELPAELELTDEEKKALKYLDKPRKPDQLERAMNNRRMVRVLLRLLGIFSSMKVVPQAKAIPIAKASLVKTAPTTGVPSTTDPTPEPATVEAVPTPPPAKAEAPRERPNANGSARPHRAEEQKVLQEIKVFHKDLGQKNHFEILGVPVTAVAADIKKAFHVLAKKYHPDSLPADLPEDMAQLVREVSARVNEAYQVLSNEKSRAEYHALVADDRIKGDARKLDKIREGEVKHQMATVMLRKREYQKAREYFTYALENDPENGEYMSSLAWAMYADAQFDREQAMSQGFKLLQDALKRKPVSANTHYYLGQLYKAKGQDQEALAHFKKAVERDRKHADAAREIRLMEMRASKPAKEESSSALSKLFKRS